MNTNNIQKVNYQKILDKITDKIEKECAEGENRPALFLHACCAPCSSYVLEYLTKYFKITIFYYNPNITPETEYTKRVKELQRFIQMCIRDSYKTADEVMGILTGIDGIKKVSALDGNASVTSSMLGTGTTDNYTSFSFNIITEDNIKTTKEFRKIRKEIESKTKRVKCKEITVSSSAMGDMSSLSGGGLSVNVYGENQQKLSLIHI